tara:strand:+ start:211 stop:519 length:309 start_codon:yes stop_codon:yes gene_type:complete
METLQINQIIEQFNYEALLELFEEQFGSNKTNQSKKSLFLYFGIQRKHISENYLMMESYLLRNKITSSVRESESVIKKYHRIKNVLPNLNQRINNKLNTYNF